MYVMYDTDRQRFIQLKFLTGKPATRGAEVGWQYLLNVTAVKQSGNQLLYRGRRSLCSHTLSLSLIGDYRGYRCALQIIFFRHKQWRFYM